MELIYYLIAYVSMSNKNTDSIEGMCVQPLFFMLIHHFENLRVRVNLPGEIRQVYRHVSLLVICGPDKLYSAV